MSNDIPENDDTRTLVVLNKGTMVAHYRISEKIGTGGMGEVYLAEDTKLNRKVALKFLADQFFSDQYARNRFTREAQAVAAMYHPNIVSIYEVNEFKSRPYFAMQYVEGKSLSDIIKGNQLQLSEIIRLAIQICEGLQAAHNKGIVHRDIKPSNILIDKDGRARILDFGLARIRGMETLTRTGTTMGTLYYMSPEQVQAKETDLRSDIFSFGVVLYEMITGKRPFGGDSDAAILHAITYDEVEPLARFKSGVTDKLQQIVNKALQKEQSLRYQTAADMLADFKQVTATDFPKQKSKAIVTIAAGIILLIAMGTYFIFSTFLAKTTPEASSPKRIVVLPFENLGAAEDEYFADGITDEITSRLASVSGLGVISRTSAIQYKDSKKSLPEIARELGVDYVLEGTIRWDKSGDTDRVRITPQLIDVSDNTHLWAENYEWALTQIFAVQQEIALEIVNALNVTLSETEVKAFGEVLTLSMPAYDFYLRGNQYFYRGWKRTDLETAGELYSKAIELDSNLAEAYAMLSRVHSTTYWEYFDRSPGRCERAFEIAKKALSLRSDIPQVYIALGYCYYHCRRDYNNALLQFQRGLAEDPNNSNLYTAMAAVQRRQGRINESLENQKKAMLLDPRAQLKSFNIAVTLGVLRRFAEADEYLQKTINIAPDLSIAHIYRASLPILRYGDVAESERILTDALNLINLGESKYYWWLLKMINLTPQMTSLTPSSDTVAYYLFKAQHNRLSGEPEQEKVYADSAKHNLAQKIEESRDDAWFHSSLGLAYAGLRQTDSAIAHCRIALDLLSTSDDYFDSPFLLFNFAEVLVIFGLHDETLDQLELIMSIPGFTSAAYLRIDPLWKPLRHHPRFKALVEDSETIN